MKIVQVNAYHYPYRGGIEHRIHNVSKRLAKRHDVTVLTSQMPGTSEIEEIDGYTVVRLPSKYINIYNPPHVTTHGLVEKLNSLAPDIVDFHYRWAPTYNKAARDYSGKKCFTFHNTFGEGVGITRLPSIINDQLWKPRLKRFQKIICVSDFVLKDLERRGVNRGNLISIPNGIEIPDVIPRAKEEDFILFVGRLVNTKGLPYLIKAMRSIDSRLVICGAGPEERKLRELVEKKGLSSKVEFAGKVTEERKVQLMSSCKLFVMPSIFESYGIAVAEAMMYSKAIVASNIGGLPEVIQDAGLLCRPKDPSDLADKISLLLKDDQERNKLAVRAGGYASTYSWDLIALRMERVYQDSMRSN